MLNFNDPPILLVAESNEPENEIRTIFSQHLEKMRNQTNVSFIAINEWRRNTTEHINKHADEQIQLLQNDYTKQRAALDRLLEENLETTQAYIAVQNGELFGQLRDECQKLTILMSQLEYVKADIECPRLTTVEEQVQKQKQQQQCTTFKSDVHQSNVKSEHILPMNVLDKQTENECTSIVSPTSNETQPQPLSIATTTDDNIQAANVQNEIRNEVVENENPIDKCPICYMIFPMGMPSNERIQHVNEHYSDD